MASCSLGAPNNKLLKLQFGGTRAGFLQQGFGTRSWIRRKPVQHPTLVMPQQSVRSLTASPVQSIEIQSITRSEDSSEDIHPSGVTSELVPKFHEVEFLLNTICDSSSVGEFELKLDGFHLRVVRGLSEKNKTLPLTPACASVNTVTEAPKSNGLASSSTLSLAISKPLPSPESIQRFLDKATDEGLVIIQSPKVGFFRRSRTIKGKRAPPSCKENQKVEEGQVICFIEQLGGQLPIESDVSGEIVKILRKDGEPVGYGDAIIAVLPSFPGIKIQ
ncbi:hypothetical protein PIB30_007558 [Stylosanthes scabra]|uniref:Lipoyl-binding domain-containing protein n=1 Tax=Stylosanthes scabra TaxID=79078 RepID=A0ABU6T6N7_9FABA|nr:hypothetical protein [Stylosanthes scabra]